jgi:hypothetical protein
MRTKQSSKRRPLVVDHESLEVVEVLLVSGLVGGSLAIERPSLTRSGCLSAAPTVNAERDGKEGSVVDNSGHNNRNKNDRLPTPGRYSPAEVSWRMQDDRQSRSRGVNVLIQTG